MNTERIDVRREPLVVRDGCAPDRIPAGRWPSDDPLVRSEQFAVNEAIASLGVQGDWDRGNGGNADSDDGDEDDGTGDRGNRDWVFAMHAPPGTGVSEVFGDLVAAIVTERARRLADLADPAAAFGEGRAWGAHTVTAPAPALTGFEIVLSSPGGTAWEPWGALGRPSPGLPPIGAGWRDRATRADYFASTARLADGVGAWAMLAARLGDRAASRAFAERWWHGAIRGADVLFPPGESMAAALRRLRGMTVSPAGPGPDGSGRAPAQQGIARNAVYWPACVAWFRSKLARVQDLAEERRAVAAALSRLSLLEQACEEASSSVECARARLAELTAGEPLAREAVTAAEEKYRSALAALGAHELGRPVLTTVTPVGVTALRSRGALSVALAGGVRRGLNWHTWSVARRELRAACAVAERGLEAALRAAETLREEVAAARSAVTERIEEVSRLTAEMEPLAATVAEARQRWGDCVPVGPSQAETEDPMLIEWRETSSPWADEEYAKARAEAFIAALELHKALIAAQADVFEANLAALMDLIAPDSGSGATGITAAADAGGADAGAADGADPGPGDTAPDGTAPDETELTGIRLAAWRSFFLVVPVVQAPFEATGSLFDGLGAGSLGWLLAAGAEQLAADEVPGLMRRFDRAVFAGDTVVAGEGLAADRALGGSGDLNGTPPGPDPAHAGDVPLPAPRTAQHLADQLVRYGTRLPTGRWIGVPLRVVRGQDRTTVERRNDLAYDGLLIAGRH